MKNFGSIKNINTTKKRRMITIILFMVILLSSIIASLIQSNFGKVTVTTESLDTRDNQTLVYDLYVPDSATTDNLAPAIVIIAGFQRSRETQGHLALEFARRGFVVFNIDPYSQGDSTSSSGVQGTSIATLEGYGSFDLIDYIYDNDDVYPFIDKTRIGVTGHSAGGNAALQAAIHFGKDAVNNHGVSKVNSVFVSGYVLSIQSDISFSLSNMGIDYALYDEGAFRNQVNPDAPIGTSLSDMTWMIESHDFVNSGLEKSGLDAISYGTQVELGKIYGNPNLRNMRQVFNTPIIHAFQPYSLAATTNIINFFEIAMNFRSQTITPSNQIWVYKEIFTTISLIASLALLVPFTGMLYEIPFFKKTLKAPVIVLTKRTKIDLMVYILLFVLAAGFAALMYLPSAKLTLTLFEKASNSVNSWFFPQRMTNAVAVWAVLSGLFSAFLFVGYHFLSKAIGKNQQKEVPTTASWGINMKFKDVMKTFLLGIIVITLYFTLLNIIQALLHVDYRFLFIMSARHVNFRIVLQLLMYFPLFFVFYFSNSIRVNGSQMHGKLGEAWKMVLAAFMNIAGLAILLIIQYVTFANTGTIAFTELPDGTTQWLYINILFTLLPVMFLMPLFNRWFYKLSGNAYIGPVIICGIFLVMALSNSVAYLPN
ncbi:MAG: alpha/beta hydrolase family protein [Candidatus Izemoplasmatales bacterium]